MEDPKRILDLAGELKQLARSAATDASVDDLVRRGLDWLARLAPYDLATFFVLEENRLVARIRRGVLADRVPEGYSLPLERFPTIRAAIDTRRARAFTEEEHAHGDGDPFDGVLDLPPGHSCMVVPLFAGDRTVGALTLDRTRCEVYPAAVVDLVETYAWILALAISSAEQKEALARLAAGDEERARLLETELAGDVDRVMSSANPAFREMARRARQVAETDTAVLLLGETGTGKERLARAIHEWSPRAPRPFVKINCAALPAALLESELFGHVKGAFTGATRDRPGRFAVANGGTLLLDEIGELPMDLQAKLLRVLQEGTFEPVGSDRTVKVDVRVLAATHVDLLQASRERHFREDLYYRLNVFPLSVPPLRDRLEDLPALCSSLLAEQAARTGRRGVRVSKEGLTKLRGYRWPGNIRELANVLERAVILSAAPVLGAEALDLPRRELIAARLPTELGTENDETGASSSPDDVLSLDEVQRRYIRQTLTRTGGRIYGKDGAAARLGMKPSTLQSRMKKLEVDS